MNEHAVGGPIARQFRQILMWPLQLMPLGPRTPERYPWEVLVRAGGAQGWHEVEDEFTGDPSAFQERHYREFVTFMPHVQRFLYGQGRSSSSARGYGESPMRIFRRCDVAAARLTFDDDTQLTLRVQHVDLYFYYDVDVVLLALEYYARDVPLHRVQDIVFRFGRTFPAQWNEHGVADQCLRNVEWLAADGQVMCDSDFAQRQVFLRHTCQHRQARVARHWDFLLRPMVQHDSEHEGEIRYRELEYHHVPKMTYLSLDDPFVLSRADFFRLGMALEPDEGRGGAYSPRLLRRFERDHCYDYFWVPGQRHMRASTRVVCTPRGLVMVGCEREPAYSDLESGMLGEFRHQYFLLGMIVHFHHAAFLMMSDRIVLAVSHLDVDDPLSLERFRLHIRDTTETFLRFNHRYWFHEVSQHLVARDIYRMWSGQLGNDALFQEVREELLDMGQYLDGDAARRQGDVVLRLTVVTIFGLIGTIATGFLGMNLIDETEQPLALKLLYFMAVMLPSLGLTFLTVLKSGSLARFIDAMADERLTSRQKLQWLRTRRSETKPGLDVSERGRERALPEVTERE
jgi:hypothetical protein